MISQNFKILSKLDTLISAQQLIDDRLKKIEGSSDESSSEEVIKTIVVEVARNLLKVSIYPSQNEFREETEKVLRSSFPELHKKFRQSPIFYEKNIYQPLLAKHRSFRGSLTSRIKDALYTIFPELPSITSNSPPSEIRQWKSNPIVASCHNKLFKKIVVEEPTTFMSKILDRLFPSKKSAPKIYVAYAISVCEYILNPSNQQIQVSESAIKFLISKYLQKVLNKEKLVSSDEDEAATTSITATASKTAAAQEKEEDQEEDQEYQGQEEQEQEEGQEEQEQEQEGQEEQEQEEDIFNLIIGQEIGNQKDEVKGGGDNDLYNYSSSNEDELFKIKAKGSNNFFFIGIFFFISFVFCFYFFIFFLLLYYFIIYIIVVV